MKTIANLIIVTLMYANCANAQYAKVKTLKIGDRVPEVILNHIINYSDVKAKISDFRGKLVILDFFNYQCGSCIASFPRMEELQNKFGNKIEILLVTQDSFAVISKLMQTSPIVKTTHLPIVTGNSELYSHLFKHNSDPYHVWIGEDGIVKAITSSYNTDSINIAQYLNSKKISLTIRNDCPDWDDEIYKSLLKEGNGRQLKYINSSSVLMNYIPCIRMSTEGITTDSLTGKMIGFKTINISIIGLYQMAYYGAAYGQLTYQEDRIILEIPHPEDYIEPYDNRKMDEWKQKNLFCYELRVPSAISWTCPVDSTDKKLRRMMRSDLDRYLFKASTERRNIKCWILVRNNLNDTLKVGQKDDAMFEHTRYGYVIRNISLTDFVSHLGLENRKVNGPPFIDETNYPKNIDMDLNCSLNDIPQLNKELSKYGLGLIEANRQIDVLVLRDNEDQ